MNVKILIVVVDKIQIWAEVNVGGLTYLKKEEFCTALKLIALAQNGRDPSIQNLITTTSKICFLASRS